MVITEAIQGSITRNTKKSMVNEFMRLIEKKDHIINKIPALTPEQKKIIIDYFNKHPNEESKIDWNKYAELTFSDFEPILNTVSITAKKKQVHDTGINGLKEWEDYVVVYDEDYVYPENEDKINFNVGDKVRLKSNYGHYMHTRNKRFLGKVVTVTGRDTKAQALRFKGSSAWFYDEIVESIVEYGIKLVTKTHITGYVPLNWEASKLIASPYVGASKDTGKWCSAYQKDRSYWDDYCGDEDKYLIYFIDMEDVNSEWGKVAVLADLLSSRGDYEVFDKYDNNGEWVNIPEFINMLSEMKPIFTKSKELIKKVGGITANKTSTVVLTLGLEYINQTSMVLWCEHQLMDIDDDVIEEGDWTTKSTIKIRLIGKKMDVKVNADLLYMKFGIMNGTGVYIEYDRTIADAIKNAKILWTNKTQNFDHDYDNRRIIGDCQDYFDKYKIDYVVIKTNNLEDVDKLSLIWNGYVYDTHNIKPYKDINGIDYVVIANMDYDSTNKVMERTLEPMRLINNKQRVHFGL